MSKKLSKAEADAIFEKMKQSKQISETEMKAAVEWMKQELAELKKVAALWQQRQHEQKQRQNENKQYQQYRQQQGSLTVGIPSSQGPFQTGPVANPFDQRWQFGGCFDNLAGGATPRMNYHLTGGEPSVHFNLPIPGNR